MPLFRIERRSGFRVLRLQSADLTNRLTRACVVTLTKAMRELAQFAEPVIITGNHKFFSAGADLSEIAGLSGPAAFAFSQMGQELMESVESFPAPVLAAINGYCMGGGLDLALACHRRIVAPHAVLGHRGAALGLITGWGGTQRLPRLIGKDKAMKMFLTAEKVRAAEALRIGLVDLVAADPVEEAAQQLVKISGRADFLLQTESGDAVVG